MLTQAEHFKFTVIATDVVIFTVKEKKLNVLLIKMKKDPYLDFWACPGGLVNPNESVEESAKKQLEKKAGIKDVYLEQLYTFGDIDRDPFGRVVSVAYFALIPSKGVKLKTSENYSEIRWFSVSKLPKLAYDHKQVVETAVSRLQNKLGYSNIVYSLLPQEFSLSELQEVYQTILGRKLDKRNFRKKILGLSLVQKTGKKRTGEANRPAELYRFSKMVPEIVEIL